MIRSLLTLSVILVLSCCAYAQHQWQPGWLVYRDNAYQPVEDRSAVGNTFYVKVDPYRSHDGSLVINSPKPYFIFVNGELIAEGHDTTRIKLSELSAFSAPYTIGIFQDGLNPRAMHVVVEDKSSGIQLRTALAAVQKPESYFKDFVILSGITLIVLFVAIMNLNPKLASDYFSVVKIFSLRDADDAQSNARLTSSANIQFYIASCLLIGFFLMIILRHLPQDYALPLKFKAQSFGQAIVQWLRLSLIALFIFGVKIVLVFNLTRLFDMRGLARVHFFNWIRLVLIVVGVLTIVIFVYFINRGQHAGFFATLLTAAVALMLAWVIVVFMKLSGKTDHSMFHLFSYICATEIIPLVVTIKVLFQ